jgi:hypothetical protein
MKTLNSLLVAAAAAVTLGATFSAQAGEAGVPSTLSRNTAVLASPRYLEEHPELLRGKPSGWESPSIKAERVAKLTENAALANSPRFREEHPELRWLGSSPDYNQAISERDRLNKLTENAALANSPRFREEHPELLHVEPMIEIAPLK